MAEAYGFAGLIMDTNFHLPTDEIIEELRKTGKPSVFYYKDRHLTIRYTISGMWLMEFKRI